MGKRITIDSATLMNKGFEVIEACRLFDLRPDRVRVLVHPQSTIHSLVEFRDGSILAQLSVTDMRLPILYALTYPERLESDLKFDLASLQKLDFYSPDFERFPCLRLAYEAAEAGGAKTIALNAADEVAVAAFLDGVIGFNDIFRTISRVLDETGPRSAESIREVLQMDAEARALAAEVIAVEKSPAASRMGIH
jgi:1-deoxy-D-xylulose-5-phosphate reductoisomerase